jgi:hypothetical protein
MYNIVKKVLTSTLMKNLYYVYWKHTASAYSAYLENFVVLNSYELTNFRQEYLG